MTPDPPTGRTEHRPVLAVHDLRFAYRRGAQELFGGLTHQFGVSRITAVTGPSGRGKSTLLYVLGLLLRPSAGEVRLAGEPVSGLSDLQRSGLRARHIGFVFQDAVLDPSRTVLEAVLEPALYAGVAPRGLTGRARELLDRLDVAGRVAHRPGEVSGGQAQRVALARALINEPAVVLADEPTGNLDRANADVVLETLRAAAAQGCTVIVATHDPFVIRHADEELTL